MESIPSNSNASSWGITLDTNSSDQITGSTVDIYRTFSSSHSARISELWFPSDPAADESFGSTGGAVGISGQGYNFTPGAWSKPNAAPTPPPTVAQLAELSNDAYAKSPPVQMVTIS
jgi:hypothetical protein